MSRRNKMKEDEPETNNPEPSPEKPSFFTELKRRKVMRVAITYAIVAWLIIQIASATFGWFEIPAWAFRFVTIMLILGFPVALIITWAFELTPDGVKLTKNVEPSEDHASFQAKRNWLAMGLAAALPTVIFGTLALVFYFGKSDSAPPSGSEYMVTEERPYVIGSIAVLPFETISASTEVESIALGLHEEMLTQLSEMKPLDVVSRTSSLTYVASNKSVREIGRELEAEFVIECSLQPVGEITRVTLQLIEAESDQHLLSKSFDRDPSASADTLLFQKELAYEMALTAYQALKAQRPPVGEAKATLDRVVAGMWDQALLQYDTEYWEQGNFSEGESHYRPYSALMRKIIAIDPDNIQAHSKLGMIMAQAPWVGEANRDGDPVWEREYLLQLKRAYLIDPRNQQILEKLGSYYIDWKNRPAIALPYLKKSVEEFEASGEVTHNWPYLHLAGAYGKNGQLGAAVRTMERATFAPDFIQMQFWVGVFGAARDFATLEKASKAAAENERAKGNLELARYLEAYGFLAATAAWTGSRSEVARYLELIENDPNHRPETKSWISVALGDWAVFLEHYPQIEERSSMWNIGEAYANQLRGIAYIKTGNEAIGHNYLRSSLKETEAQIAKGEWMPGQLYARKSTMEALLGMKTEALESIATANELLDISRNMQAYFQTQDSILNSYNELGMTQKACETLDLLLSNPSGYSTGNALIRFGEEDICKTPQFEAIIRKHANQLKDPAVLEEYFGVEN